MIKETEVFLSVVAEKDGYPHTPPFRPGNRYPELENDVAPGEEANLIFDMCRDLFFQMKLDEVNFGSPCWNPMGELVRPGDRVLVKPNLVRHLHLGGGEWFSVVTHGSLIRCILDYIGLALKGQGEIVVGDAPVQSADFEAIATRLGLVQVCEECESIWRIPVRLVDFRRYSVIADAKGRFLGSSERGYQDYIPVDLGSKSALEPLNTQTERFRVTSYGCEELANHHKKCHHEYLIPKAVLQSDVVLNLPKLKTHRKAGLTAALKNCVGINGNKDWLPHHRHGSISEGGDEYLAKSVLKQMRRMCNEFGYKHLWVRKYAFYHLLYRALDKLTCVFSTDHTEEGSWYGNDTLWRTVLDINRVLMYANTEGKLQESVQRRVVTIVDAVLAGEGEGPMEPDSRYCGMLAAGTNPAAVDAALATIVGFDYRKIPLVLNAFELRELPIAEFQPQDVVVKANFDRWSGITVGESCRDLSFKPSAGWVGHIEYKRSISS